MKYKIKISYRTGDSFSSNNAEDFLELEWAKLDVAKENLKRIQEHYAYYEKCSDNYAVRKGEVSKEKLTEEAIKKDWFVLEKKLFNATVGCYESEEGRKKRSKNFPNEEYRYVPDEYYAEHCIKLVTDEGNTMQMHCFWCGYFETLYGAEIIPEEDTDDMKFSLR